MDIDAKAEAGVFVAPSGLPSKRIIFSGTGPMDKDYDDVRSYHNAADKGLARAISAGCKAPLLVFAPGQGQTCRFPQAAVVSVLGAMKAAFVPLEVREDVPARAKKVDKLGVYGDEKNHGEKMALARALEAGRVVSRCATPEHFAVELNLKLYFVS